HMYDGRRHWYGFYVGPVFYWSLYENNLWWYYDSVYGRYNYWSDGYWWYRNPLAPGAAYVYYNNFYYYYQSTPGGVILQPQQPAPGANLPAPPVNQQLIYSLDGTRVVQIAGAQRDAVV